MVADDLESSLNAGLAKILGRLFEDRRINRKGGMLIFSTNSAETVDEFDRRDCILVTRNNNGISAECLSTLPARRGIRKSESYRSGLAGGTASSSGEYLELRESFSML